MVGWLGFLGFVTCACFKRNLRTKMTFQMNSLSSIHSAAVCRFICETMLKCQFNGQILIEASLNIGYDYSCGKYSQKTKAFTSVIVWHDRNKVK